MTQRVYEYLLDAADEAGDCVALTFRGEHVTFGALCDGACHVAAGLRALGLESGETIGLILPNVPHFAEALYGAWMNDNVVVPLNVLLTAPEIRYVVDDSKIRLLFVFEMFLPQVEAAIRGMAKPPILVVVGQPHGHVPYAQVRTSQAPERPEHGRADAHLLTIYTSGTTGKPKGAVINNSNVIAQMDMADDLFDTQADDATLCVLPLFHVFALNGVLNGSIRHRTRIVLHPKFELDAVVRSLSDDGVTSFSGVPTMYFYILNHPEVDRMKFPKLRRCVSGGAAMPVEVMTDFERRFGVPIYEGYGLTETTVSVCCNREGAKKVGSVGKPYPGVELRIVDDEGADVPTNQAGEIIVRGPNVMQRYLNRPEATAEAIRDGWFHTGDIGKVDEDGFVFIVDRKKDMILKGGYNIYPREIEEVLYAMDGVAEAAVVGIQDAAKGEQVRAIISPTPGSALTAERIAQHLSEHLAKYKLPSEYVFMDELPKGPTGKILKRELRG